nr:MAG TPA: hypothetical protein [Caudoviricetes sp.]
MISIGQSAAKFLRNKKKVQRPTERCRSKWVEAKNILNRDKDMV